MLIVLPKTIGKDKNTKKNINGKERRNILIICRQCYSVYKKIKKALTTNSLDTFENVEGCMVSIVSPEDLS